MYNQSLSFVIPAFNEQENIAHIVADAHQFLSNHFGHFEIIVIDDGSTDNTQFECEQLISTYGSKLIVLRHTRNRGYGAALRTGLFSAKNELVFYTDSDCQFAIEEMKQFMEYIKDTDLVIGFRKNRQDAFIRKFSSRIFNRLIFVIFGLDIKDIDCSFKLFRKDALQKLSIETDEFLVDTELLVKAMRKKLKIKELPVTHYPRKRGKSTVKFRHIFSTIRDIFFLAKQLRKRTHD